MQIIDFLKNSVTDDDDNLLAVLHSTTEVTDWLALGLVLGLPVHEFDRIEKDVVVMIGRQRGMVSLWLETGKASWKALAQALINPKVNKDYAAYRIADEHLPEG